MPVEPIPTACHLVCLTVAPMKPATWAKKAATKGKGVSQPSTQPQECKVMHLTSPLPGVEGVVIPPIAGPSWEAHTPLFKEQAISGDENVRGGVPTLSGEWL